MKLARGLFMAPGPFLQNMLKLFDIISQFCARLTKLVVTLMAMVLVVSLLTSIFFRYVVGSALSWPEEIALMLFAWIVLLSGSLGVREGFHVRLSVLIAKLPRIMRLGLDRIITLLVAGFGIALLYSGQQLVERTAEHLTPTLRLPLDLVNYSAPVCGVFIIMHSLYRLLLPLNESEDS